MPDDLNPPHGGSLVNLLVAESRAGELKAAAGAMPSWDLTPRQLCDLELLASGGFSPLRGFLDRRDYEAVCAGMRLAAGVLWPIPVVLDVAADLAGRIGPGDRLALRGGGELLAVMDVFEVWQPDRAAEAVAVFGTGNPEHPGVDHLLNRTHPFYIGGALEVLRLPPREDFPELRLAPAGLRREFARRGWSRVVAFQTRNPLHRAHQEMTMRAALTAGANLLIHPVVGMTKPGDVDHVTRVRCYQAVLPAYPPNSVVLSLLPLAMRMAGPREAVWHAIIRKNHGVTHFIVGRDHAGPGKDSSGRWFYEPYAAQDLLRRHERELKITMVEFKRMLYVSETGRYLPEDEVPPGTKTLELSGTELRRMLAEKKEIPAWFTFPQVAEVLKGSPPPAE